MSLYSKAGKTADRLMAKYTQGKGVLVVPGAVSGDEWDPVYSDPVEVPFNYTKASQSEMFKYVANSLITETDLLIIASQMDATPETGMAVSLDGVEYTLIHCDPATLVKGLPIVWRFGLRR